MQLQARIGEIYPWKKKYKKHCIIRDYYINEMFDWGRFDFTLSSN